MKYIFFGLLIWLTSTVAYGQTYDVIIKGGTVYDGSGGAPIKADVAIKGDTVVKIGDLSRAKATTIVDAMTTPLSTG